VIVKKIGGRGWSTTPFRRRPPAPRPRASRS
jgi:hypothetical protein